MIAGKCILPSSLPIQQHRFYRVIVRLDDTDAPDVAANTTALPKGVDVFSTLNAPAPVIKFGEILEVPARLVFARPFIRRNQVQPAACTGGEHATRGHRVVQT